MTDYQLNIIINGDASGLDATVASIDGLATATQTMGASATNAASQSGNFFSGLLGNLANIKAGIDMFAGLGGAVIGVGQSLIAGSAEFEGYEARFASLMGSTDAAKDKIQELSTFASTTPFELPDVIKASQSLQVFGGSALNTKENLAVVGNAAAATGQNIGDVSFWFARAYSAIQNGQPFGEAAQNLQQMGVMSGDTVVKLNALKESGASNQQVWQAFAGSLNAPVDAMTKMGTTWTGLTSTLSDSWSLLIRTFGQPLFDALKPQLQGVIDQLSSGGLIDAVGQLGSAFASVLAPAISFVAGTVIPGVVAAIQFIAPAVTEAISVINQVGSIFMELAGQAMGWGENIVGQLAGGMMNAANAVMSVLQSIGGMIADLLMPGSPPKLLPELDTWGAGAMAAYLEGWGQADFGVFNNIADSIKGALDGIAKASGDKGMNIASIMLGSQDDIAKAINEVHQFGAVSQDTFNSLIGSIGPAGAEVSGLVSAYLDLQAATQNVAAAQAALNAVTDEYAGKLAPLNAQLKDIQNQKQAIQDQKKLAELQAKLADQSLSDADRQMAMLEQQEIMTRQQIRTTEAERDTAVGASKAKLDAAKQEQAQAKARVDQQKALFDQQNKTNALIADQAKAMASVGGAVKAAGGAMAGAASATKPLADAVQGVNQTLGAARQSISDVRTNLATMGTTIQSVVAPPMEWLKGAITGLMGAAAGIAVVLGAPVVWSALGTAMGMVGTALAAVGSAVAFVLSPFGLLLIAAAALGAAITTNFMGIGTLAQNLMGIFAQFGTVISTAFAAFRSGGLTAALQTFGAGLANIGAQLVAWGAQAGTVLLNIGQAFINWITPLIPAVLTQLATWGAAIVTWIVTQGPILLTQFLAWGAALISWITPYIPIALAALGGLIVAVGGWIVAQVPPLLAQFMAWGQALIAWIAPMIPPALAALGGLIGSLLSWAGGQLGALLSAFGAWAAPLIAWIPGAITSFLAQWPAMLSGWLDTFASWAGPLLAQLATLGASIIAWVATQAGPLLAQLAVWGVQFVAWVAPMIPQVVAGLLGLATAIVVFIAQTAGVILAKVVEWGAAMLGWVAKEVLPKLPGVLKSILTTITGWITSGAGAIAGEAVTIGKSLVDGFVKGIKNGIGSVIDAAKNLARSAYDAAMDGLKSHSPSRLFAQVGDTVPQGFTVGVLREGPKAVNAVSGVMQSVIGAATKVAQAGAKSLAGTGPPASSGDMLAGLSDFVAEFLTISQTFSMKAVKGAQGFADTVGKILAVIGPAVEALGSLRTMVAPTHESVNAFGAALAYVLGEMIVTTYSFGKKSIAAAATFAESVGKILAPISTAVDAFAKLGDLVTPTHGTVDRFRAALQYVLGEMITVTYSFGPKSIAAAATFAESVGKIMGLIGPAVDAFAKLPDLVVPSHAAVSQFGQTLRTVVAMMRAVSESAKIEFVQAAATFAESAGKMIAIIGPGVDGFTKLADFGGVPARNITLFGMALRQAVGMLFAIGREFKAESVAAAAVFAEGAGKAVGMIGAASESMTKLKDFVAPAQTTFAAFGASLHATLVMLIQTMDGFTAEAIAAAGKFGEGAGKAVSFIGNAVGSFVKLKDFQNIPQEAILMFVDNLWRVFEELEQASEYFTAAGYAAAKSLYEGIGESMSVIGKAVDGIAKLKDMTNIPQATVLLFVDNLWRVFEELEQASEYFTPAGYAAAKSLQEGIGESMSVIGKAIEGFLKLKEFEAVPQKTILAFVDTLWRVFEELEQASEYFTAAGYAAAKSLNDGIGTSMSVIGRAVEGFTKLNEFTAPTPKAIASFGQTLKAVLAELNAVAGVFSADAVAITATFATNVNTIVSQVKGALQSFASLEDAKVGGDVLKSFMVSAQNLVGQMNAYLPPNAQIIGQNTVIGLINGIVSQRSALVTAMVNTVMAAVIAARQTLGIASPSKVFEQIGQYAGAGLQGGMAAMQPAIAATSAGLGISAVRATTSALRPSGGGTTNNNQRNITVNVTVGKDAGSNPYATADAVVTEINRRLGMQGT